MDNIFYRNDKLNGELKAALGQIAGALGSFEKTASNCPDREEAGTGKYCKRSPEMSPTVLEVFPALRVFGLGALVFRSLNA